MEKARSRGAPFALKEYTQTQRYGMGRQGRYIISSECQRERGAPCLACNFYVAEEEKVVGEEDQEEEGEGRQAFVCSGGVAGPWHGGQRAASECQGSRVRVLHDKKRRSETFLVRCLPLIAVLRML